MTKGLRELRDCRHCGRKFLGTFYRICPVCREKANAEARPTKDPSPEEIAERCEAVQKTWSKREEWKRRVTKCARVDWGLYAVQQTGQAVNVEAVG